MARTQVAISTDLAGDLFNICVWDVTTGNILTTYKSATNGVVPEHCLAVVGDHYLLCCYRNSPILNVWSLDKKDRLHSKMILPGPVNAVAVSDDGCYCIAALGPKIYIWQISSGYLLNILEKHYQPVGCIRIASDLSYFVSGANDGLVLIWSFAKVVARHSETSFSVVGGQSSLNDPIKSIHNSANRVTDIWIGDCGGRAHFAVSAEDNICKIYELCSGQLLSTVMFEESANTIHSLTMDRAECFLFAGASDGTIFESRFAPLSDQSQGKDNDRDQSKFVDLRHLAPSSSGEESSTAQATRSTPKYVGHTGPVTCLAVSIDGHALVSGSADCTIKLWHIESRQCMRTMNFKGPISNLLLYPALSGLFLHDSLDTQNFILDSSNVSSDISLASAGNSQQQRNRSQRQHRPAAAANSFESRYSKSQSLETILRTVQNPPLPISSFRHDVYQPGKSLSKTKDYRFQGNGIHDENDNRNGKSSLDPFQTGSVCIRNDSRSGSEFWPWQDFDIPNLDDIEKLFSVDKYINLNRFLPKSTTIVESNVRSGKRPKTKNSHNGSGGDQLECPGDENVEDEEEEEEHDVKNLENLVNRLTHINQKLYQYSVDKVFDSIAK